MPLLCGGSSKGRPKKPSTAFSTRAVAHTPLPFDAASAVALESTSRSASDTAFVLGASPPPKKSNPSTHPSASSPAPAFALAVGTASFPDLPAAVSSSSSTSAAAPSPPPSSASPPLPPPPSSSAHLPDASHVPRGGATHVLLHAHALPPYAAVLGLVCGHGGDEAAAMAAAALPHAFADAVAEAPAAPVEEWVDAAVAATNKLVTKRKELAYQGASVALVVVEAVLADDDNDNANELSGGGGVGRGGGVSGSRAARAERRQASLGGSAWSSVAPGDVGSVGGSASEDGGGRSDGVALNVYVGNCGGCGVYTVRHSAAGSGWLVAPVGSRHTPDDATEAARVVSEGGLIVNGKVMGVGPMTRAIGDAGVAGNIINAVPDVAQIATTRSLAFVLVFSPHFSSILASHPNYLPALAAAIPIGPASLVASTIHAWGLAYASRKHGLSVAVFSLP